MNDIKQQVKRLFDSMAQAMAVRDVDGFLSHFAVPFVIYVLDEIVVASTKEEMRKLLEMRLRTAMTDEVERISAKLVDTEINGDGRATVIVQWTFHGFDSSVLRSNLIRYMVSQRRNAPGLAVEIAEYLWVSDTPMAKYIIDKMRAREPAWVKWH
jgi:hypothetical protein